MLAAVFEGMFHVTVSGQRVTVMTRDLHAAFFAANALLPYHQLVQDWVGNHNSPGVPSALSSRHIPHPGANQAGDGGVGRGRGGGASRGRGRGAGLGRGGDGDAA